MNELKRMGTEPELQLAEVFYPYMIKADTPWNSIVKIYGTLRGKSVLVDGHYNLVEEAGITLLSPYQKMKFINICVFR